MDQNDKNNKNRRGNRNLLGAVKLVAWALVLTLVFYCTSSYMGSAGKQASNINITFWIKICTFGAHLTHAKVIWITIN